VSVLPVARDGSLLDRIAGPVRQGLSRAKRITGRVGAAHGTVTLRLGGHFPQPIASAWRVTQAPHVFGA